MGRESTGQSGEAGDRTQTGFNANNWVRSCLALGAIFALLSVLGCGDSQAGNAGTGGTSGTGGSSSGNCATGCGSTEMCVSGTCVCRTGLTLCGSSCVDVTTAPTDCGACGQACPAAQLCSNGQCVTDCPADREQCGLSCVDSTSDPANCGTCGTVCAVGQLCVAGQCACPSGQTLCAGACVDTTGDPNHCGGCGVACAAGQLCSGSACGTTCAATETLCGTLCVDAQTNATNCGTCGNACASGETCTAGQCACPTGLSLCGAGCVDTTTDLAHCGGCNAPCAAGRACSGGVCQCPTGQTDCSGVCVDTARDELNCGTCGTSCGAGEACSSGTCQGGVLALTALAANTTVGLEWPRVDSATTYRVHWSTSPGVNTATASFFDSTEPATVHRGLTNGTTYYYVVSAITAAGQGPPSNEVSSVPTGEWVLEELGAGDFNDVVTGGRVPRLPIEDRVHILLLPEGYLSTELGVFHTVATHDGTRANDVDRWVDEVFAIEPYPSFREAFVIWYLPRASAAHTGAGDTAFDIVLTAGGVTDVAAAAAPLFSALDALGSDAFAFPPPTPITNTIAAFMILDPARGRAGFSGITTQLTNPSNTSQRIRSAFARGHAHEFTHAFSNLRDEYMENDNTITSTAETSNVAHVNTCSALPWAHLLYGAGINQTQNLVGAFGRPSRGYHSELYCLLNGTHENGDYWCTTGASLTLRSDTRMCNFCREITAYRVFDRTGLLPGSAGFAVWKTDYRSAYFQRFGFAVPAPVPQTLTCPGGSATPVYEACIP